MKYEFINGNDLIKDVDFIKQTIDEAPETVFIYKGQDRIYEYIEKLTDDEDEENSLSDDYLYKFKVCYEKDNLNLSVTKEEDKTQKIIIMSDLIKLLDREVSIRIVVESDSREELAFILQQLIYIHYPLEKVDIFLRKEEQDADKVKRFMKNISSLVSGCNTAKEKLAVLRESVENNEADEDVKEKCLKDVDEAIKSCEEISKKLDKANSVELKFAVAATKKAGKSVMVNCFLGEEIAPTDNELATPNNCIYKSSKDGLYHLEHDGKDDDRTFETRKEIYKTIKDEFKAAEKNVDEGFTTLDMNIGYVTDKDIFSSYTIYDTPGPNAAGTKHREAAYNALLKCDVAVFAMDYSKHLEENEENYLREVKQTFQKQNKFHSLLFALNKIDTRFNDVNTPKSIVKSVDFIKKRLSDIDKSYEYIVIFPTCSLEYFNAIEAENNGANELSEENPVEEMGKIVNSHKKIKSLHWLKTHCVDNLSYYHGLEKVSYDILKNDSGMPALMNYVSYIANGKAREEIINNVAYDIDAQKRNLQVIIDYINNLETFINMGDDKINKITQIIRGYKDETSKILNPGFKDDDLNVLESNDLLKIKNGDYNKILDLQEQAVADILIDERIASNIYNSIVDELYSRITKCKRLDNDTIGKLFNSQDFTDIVNSWLRRMAGDSASETYRLISKVCGEITKIIARRQNLLGKLSDKCRAELEKENVFLSWSDLPSFKPATSNPPVGDMKIENVTISFQVTDRIKDAFTVTFTSLMDTIGNILSNFEKLFTGNKSFSGMVIKEAVNKEKFYTVCETNLKDRCFAEIYRNRIPDNYKKHIVEVVIKEYMGNIFQEIKNFFENMNNIYKNSVDKFTEAIDDREKYIADNQKYLRRKDVISSITDSTSDFMTVWNEIVGEIASAEK